jgi:hypothetical protein
VGLPLVGSGEALFHLIVSLAPDLDAISDQVIQATPPEWMCI